MRSPHRYINRLAHERVAVERLKLLVATIAGASAASTQTAAITQLAT